MKRCWRVREQIEPHAVVPLAEKAVQFLSSRRSSEPPGVRTQRHDAGHTATVDHPGGGEFAHVAWNWITWQFKGDREARSMFVGDDCRLCTSPNWDTRSKRLQ